MSLNLAEGMAARGLAVDLVLVNGAGPFLAHVPPSVRVVDLRCRRHLTSLGPLARYLRRERPDVLLSALTHTNLYALAARRLARAPVRVVIRINNTLGAEMSHQRGLVARVLRPWALRHLYPEADGMIAVSEGAADGLRATLGPAGDRVRTIPNPVISPALFERARAPLAHPWFAPGEKAVLLSVGRLVPQKNHELLLRAFILARERVPARLLILGEGEERPRLERLIRESGLEADVALGGFIDNPYPYMAAARGVVLSSRFEGAPSVLVESLALGVPVVSTDCPSGPREILAHGRWGRLVPVEDPDSLGLAMAELARGTSPPPPPLPELARFTLDHAVEHYIAVMGLA